MTVPLGTGLAPGALEELLEPWLVSQRWFAGKGRRPRLEVIGALELETEPGVESSTIFLVLDHATDPLLYQVPITMRRELLAGAEPARIASVVTGEARVHLYDGPRDPAFSHALLRLILGQGTVSDSVGTGAGSGLSAVDLAVEIGSSRVLGGEQSNTSIVYETVRHDGRPSSPIVCKLFRTIHNGENPDVVLTTALGTAGSRVAPTPVGHVSARWRDRSAADGVARGHLAFAEEFLPGSEDAWRVAMRTAERGEEFVVQARELGRVTADMHATLAKVLPTQATTPIEVTAVIASMRERYDRAARAVPQLESLRSAFEAACERAVTSPWPSLQRVHGDLHLGQVLDAPDRGWVVLDFEGEPLRSMQERSMPDLPLRDVAGMLRSFDYVGGALLREGVEPAAGWTERCRAAYVQGYGERLGTDLTGHRALLDTFEIDKALYEVSYEASNRPEWLPIPVAALVRLLAA